MKNKDKLRKFPVSIRKVFIAGVIAVCIFYFFSVLRFRRWDGASRYTIAINSDPLALFSIEPRSQRAILLTFPSNTMLDVPYGYAGYPASSVYRLGQLDTKRSGGLLLSKSIENSLGIAVFGFISPKTDSWKMNIASSEELVNIKKKYFTLSGSPGLILQAGKLLNNFQTDISLVDFFSLWNSIRKLRSDQISLIRMEDSKVLIRDKLADGSSVFRIDDDILDFLTGENFHNALIRSERFSIEVTNATGYNRLATQFARILNNLGANVILKNTSGEIADTACTVNMTQENLSKSSIVIWLIKQYHCRIGEKNNSDLGKQADLQIILGKDYIK